MDSKWQNKLRRMGVSKGARNLKTPLVSPVEKLSPPVVEQRAASSEPTPLTTLLPGLELVETADGACYVLDRVYPLSFEHGRFSLADLLNFSPDQVLFEGNGRASDCSFHDFLFLDTETTGLAGAGTIAFMVGAAFFDANETLITRQYFLRDHGDETAMLLLLDALLKNKAGIITFNGRSFDIPLLDTRYLMNRINGRLLDLPHIDLLIPSRRLWRRRLGSVALSALEPAVLGVHRRGDDVAGFLIPRLYHDYLRVGDGVPLARVFYHNAIDLLSMVTLTALLCRQYGRPQPDDPPADLLSLGKWEANIGLKAKAEQHLRWAAAGDLSLETHQELWGRLALLLKRQERRDEAVTLWRQIAAASYDAVDAHIELAKHYEWQMGELKTAVNWTEQALTLTNNPITESELQHRLARLRRKLQAQSR